MPERISRRRFLALLGAAALLYTIPGSIRSYTIQVEEVDLGLGRRILFAPDIHTHGGDRGELVEIASALRPDILILGGDLWDRMTPSWGPVESLLGELSRAAGTMLYVVGNHEVAVDAAGRIRLREAVRRLEDLGVHPLLDDKVSLGGLIIAGLAWRDNPRRYEEHARRLGEADVVVSHSPDSMPHLLPRQPVLLAGHTHGGQVCIPGGRPLATNSVYGYTWGIYREGGRLLLLSRGAGEMIPPRLYCSRHVYLVR